MVGRSHLFISSWIDTKNLILEYSAVGRRQFMFNISTSSSHSPPNHHLKNTKTFRSDQDILKVSQMELKAF